MFGINYTLLFWAEFARLIGNGRCLQASIPIFGMVFAHWMLPEEPLRWQRLARRVGCRCGVAFICARLLSLTAGSRFWGAGVRSVRPAPAFSNVVLKSQKIQLAPSMMAAWQMIFGTVPLLVLGFSSMAIRRGFIGPGGDFLPALPGDDRIITLPFSFFTG